MKNTRRIASFLLALVMVIAMAAPVFAAESYTITINESTNGYVYAAYQIFAGTLSDDETTLSDIEWGSGVNNTDALLTALKALKVGDKTPFADCTDAASVAEVLSEDSAKDNDVAKAFAEMVGAKTGETYTYLSTAAGNSGETSPYTITVADAGYYLVLNTKVPATSEENNTAEGAYTRYILQVVDDVTVTHKGTVPSVNKVIVEDSAEKEENEASIGDTINYKFTGTLPSNIADYDTYYYVFTDTLSKGLTITDKDAVTEGIQTDVEVTIGGADVTKYFYINATVNETTGETTLTVGIQDLLELENATDVDIDITAATEVVVTYTAILNENAEIGTNGNQNDVDLEYSNDPNADGEPSKNPPSDEPEEPKPEYPTGETPKDEVWTYTTEIIIEKVDENGNILTGAEFTITGENVNKVVVKTATEFVEDENGVYYKLKDGTYTSKAPVTGNDPETEEVEVANTDAYEDPIKKYSVTTTTKVYTEDAETETVEVKALVGKDGKLIVTGLGAGKYTISETTVPDGYNSIEDFTVEIGWTEAASDKEDCTWTYEWSTDSTNNTNTIRVENNAGSTLPETGGMGTTLFYVLGGLLVAAAVVLLVTKRRMGAVE